MNRLFSFAVCLLLALRVSVSHVQCQNVPVVETGLSIESYVNDYLLGEGVEAFNIAYTAYANDDDGTCLFAGCTDEEALNYSPLATIGDQSCIYEVDSESGCASDTNQDGIVSVADLLILLGEFGRTCP